jgi:hypothetical protein
VRGGTRRYLAMFPGGLLKYQASVILHIVAERPPTPYPWLFT